MALQWAVPSYNDAEMETIWSYNLLSNFDADTSASELSFISSKDGKWVPPIFQVARISWWLRW